MKYVDTLDRIKEFLDIEAEKLTRSNGTKHAMLILPMSLTLISLRSNMKAHVHPHSQLTHLKLLTLAPVEVQCLQSLGKKIFFVRRISQGTNGAPAGLPVQAHTI